MTTRTRARYPWLTRVNAFFEKEVGEIRRQPMLVISLVGGPLLVLMLFGMSFQNSNPTLRTAIVLPSGGIEGIGEERIRELAGWNFQIVSIDEDRAGAEARLRAGQLDVVQVFPADPLAALREGRTPEVEFVSSAISPLEDGWVQYLAYAEVNEINKAILSRQMQSAQAEAVGVEIKIVGAQSALRVVESELSTAQQQQIARDLRDMRDSLLALDRLLELAVGAGSAGSDVQEIRVRIARVDKSLSRIDTLLMAGDIKQERDEVQATLADLARLQTGIQVFVKTPPDEIVSPVQRRYTNIHGQAYAAVVYYAPGVLALLVQHTAVTLGALALVRERLLGALEVFRVAPVNIVQIVVGKYLGYTILIGIASVALVLALLGLGVPILGSPVLLAALLLLLTLASLGVGFLISVVAGSDSQAIQLAMVSLLISIFFSGLFISLDSFARPALAVSYIVPMTHGVAAFRDIMLRGLPPDAGAWWGLGAIAVLSFVLVLVLMRRQMRKS